MISAVDSQMLIVSTDEIPGREVVALGHVFGISVRTRNVFMNIGAGFKSLAGGEVPILTKNLENCRSAAIDRMVGMAQEKGADAITGWRFDATSDQGFMEVTAYGTAVKYKA